MDGTQAVGDGGSPNVKRSRFLINQEGSPHRVSGRPATVITLVCLAWLTHAAAAGTAGAEVVRHTHQPARSPHQIIVRTRPGTAAAQLRADLAARGLSLAGHIPHTRLFAVRTGGRSPAAAIRSLAGESRVTAAMPDYVRRAFDVPNDPYFESAEGYLTTVRLPQAWDVSHGSNGLVIAVLDTGVTAVPDLSTQVLPGRNFVAGGADARDDSTIGHGTLVAGVAAATTNNGIGIAGAAWDTSVLPVKVLDARGFGNDSQVAAGIVWAIDQGAKVINLSLGGPAPGLPLCDAVSYADSHGALVVVSAGNAATSTPNYPAACPDAVAVSATDTNGDFAYFSSFGPWVSLAAPGVAILSTRNNNSYGTESGTSLAAPIVSAVAALVIGQHPDWSPSQVATQLEETAQDRGAPGVDPYYGHGLLDAYAALGGPAQAAAAPPTVDALEPNDTAADATTLSARATATISPEGDVDWYVAKIRQPCIATFQVSGQPLYVWLGPNFRPVLQLYDDDLNLLATRDDGSAGQGMNIAARVPPGRYYLRVTNRGGARSRGTYSVVLTTVRVHHVARLWP
jgi:serine protease